MSLTTITSRFIRNGAVVLNKLGVLSGKGSLVSHDGSGHVAFPAGDDGHALLADATQAAGLRWGPPAPAAHTHPLSEIPDAGGLAGLDTVTATLIDSGGAIESQVLTADGNGGSQWVDPSGAVQSVFGRDGTVEAEAGDYGSDQIINDSSVAGVTASAALETLEDGLNTHTHTFLGLTDTLSSYDEGHLLMMTTSGLIRTEGLYFDPDRGRLGIGSNDAFFPIDVRDQSPASPAMARFYRTDAPFNVTFEFRNTAGQTFMGRPADEEDGFFAVGPNNNLADSPFFAIDLFGNVGIGTVNPDFLLDVSGGDVVLRERLAVGTVGASLPNRTLYIASPGGSMARFEADTDFNAIIEVRSNHGTSYLGRPTSGGFAVAEGANLDGTHWLHVGEDGRTTVSDVLRLTPRSSAPSNPSLGDLYVDSGSGKLRFYNGSSFVDLN